MGCGFSDFSADVEAHAESGWDSWSLVARGPLLQFWDTKKRFHYNNHYLHRYHDAGSRQDYNGGVSSDSRIKINYGALTDGPNYPVGKTCGIVRFTSLYIVHKFRQLGSRFKISMSFRLYITPRV